MATGSEIATFENFKFNIGDVVRHKTEGVMWEQVSKSLNEFGGTVTDIHPAFGMVIGRFLLQDEAGISRYYQLSGANCGGDFKEFELETV